MADASPAALLAARLACPVERDAATLDLAVRVGAVGGGGARHWLSHAKRKAGAHTRPPPPLFPQEALLTPAASGKLKSLAKCMDDSDAEVRGGYGTYRACFVFLVGPPPRPRHGRACVQRPPRQTVDSDIPPTRRCDGGPRGAVTLDGRGGPRSPHTTLTPTPTPQVAAAALESARELAACLAPGASARQLTSVLGPAVAAAAGDARPAVATARARAARALRDLALDSGLASADVDDGNDDYILAARAADLSLHAAPRRPRALPTAPPRSAQPSLAAARPIVPPSLAGLRTRLIAAFSVVEGGPSVDWQDRVAALTEVEALARGAPLSGRDRVAAVADAARRGAGALGASCLDLRSAVARQACATVKGLAEATGSALAPAAEALTADLLRGAAAPTGVAAAAAVDALTSLTVNVRPPRLLGRLAASVRGARAVSGRRVAVRCALDAARAWPPADVARAAASFTDIVDAASRDADAVVRGAGRELATTLGRGGDAPTHPRALPAHPPVRRPRAPQPPNAPLPGRLFGRESLAAVGASHGTLSFGGRPSYAPPPPPTAADGWPAALDYWPSAPISARRDEPSTADETSAARLWQPTPSATPSATSIGPTSATGRAAAAFARPTFGAANVWRASVGGSGAPSSAAATPPAPRRTPQPPLARAAAAAAAAAADPSAAAWRAREAALTGLADALAALPPGSREAAGVADSLVALLAAGVGDAHARVAEAGLRAAAATAASAPTALAPHADRVVAALLSRAGDAKESVRRAAGVALDAVAAALDGDALLAAVAAAVAAARTPRARAAAFDYVSAAAAAGTLTGAERTHGLRALVARASTAAAAADGGAVAGAARRALASIARCVDAGAVVSHVERCPPDERASLASLVRGLNLSPPVECEEEEDGVAEAVATAAAAWPTAPASPPAAILLSPPPPTPPLDLQYDHGMDEDGDYGDDDAGHGASSALEYSLDSGAGVALARAAASAAPEPPPLTDATLDAALTALGDASLDDGEAVAAALGAVAACAAALDAPTFEGRLPEAAAAAATVLAAAADPAARMAAADALRDVAVWHGWGLAPALSACLPPLARAAGADDDPDVRRSARAALEHTCARSPPAPLAAALAATLADAADPDTGHPAAAAAALRAGAAALAALPPTAAMDAARRHGLLDAVAKAAR